MHDSPEVIVIYAVLNGNIADYLRVTLDHPKPPHFYALHYASMVCAIVMCLYVCLPVSVTCQYCVKTVKLSIMQTTPGVRFLMPKILAIFGVTLNGGTKCSWLG